MAISVDNFPDETILAIISGLHRSADLASVSNVSHRFHHLVAPVLAEAKLYRSIHISSGPEDSRIFQSSLYSTLRTFLIRPTLACYVHWANVEWCGARSSHDSASAQQEAIDSNLLELAFEQMPMDNREEGDGFMRALKAGSPDAHVALLLLLLRNLEQLHITLNGEDEWVCWAIRKAGKAGSSSYRVPSLRFLREVTYSHWDTEGGFSLDSLAPYFLLPSIQKISGHMVDQEAEFKWDGEYGSSPVTELSFECSAICVEAIEELLRVPRELKRFTYWYGDDVVGFVEFDIHEIREVVKRTQSSLDDANIEIH